MGLDVEKVFSPWIWIEISNKRFQACFEQSRNDNMLSQKMPQGASLGAFCREGCAWLSASRSPISAQQFGLL